jgi:two-component system response regulator
MNKTVKPLIVLVADDDPDDRLMFKESFAEIGLPHPVHYVENGEELLLYLNRSGKYGEFADFPLPSLVFLDLNMPRKDGREALREIKTDPHFRRIPVVVFTTSKAEEDIFRTYDLGANSFISKPLSFDALVETIRITARYWLEIVERPHY